MKAIMIGLVALFAVSTIYAGKTVVKTKKVVVKTDNDNVKVKTKKTTIKKDDKGVKVKTKTKKKVKVKVIKK